MKLWLSIPCVLVLLLGLDLYARPSSPPPQKVEESPAEILEEMENEGASVPDAATKARPLSREDLAPHRRSPRWGPTPSLPETEVTFFITSDLDGRFATMRCDDEAGNKPTFGRLVQALRKEQIRLKEADALAPIIIDAGDTLGTAPISRHLASTGDNGLKKMNAFLNMIDFDLHVLGGKELQLGLQEFRGVVQSEQNALAYRAANLHCSDENDPLCRTLSPEGFQKRGYILIQRGGLRIALVPITHIPERLTTRTSRSLISFTDPLVAARRAVRRAREEAAVDLIVLVAHINDAAHGAHTAIRLARRVRGADLILTNGLASTTGVYGLQEIRFGGAQHAPIFASGGSPYEPIAVTVRLVHHGGRFRISRASSRRLTSETSTPAVSKQLSEMTTAYCTKWGKPLVDGNPPKRIDAEEFIQFVLNVLRWETKSEIAFLDRREIALQPWAGLPNTFTPDMLFRALPHRYPIRHLELNGKELAAWLTAVFHQAEDEHPAGLRFAGIERKEKAFLVNGRPIVPTRPYYLVTTPFFLLSPDAIKGLPPVPTLTKFETLEDMPNLDLRTLVERWLKEQRFSGVDAPAGRDGDLRFPQLVEKVLWRTATDLNLSFNQTAVHNPENYESEPSLTRDELIGLESSAKFRLDAVSKFHEWTNVIDMTYAATRTGDVTEFSESKDLTFFESAYAWLYMREVYLPGRTWVPVPQVKLRVETEWSEDEERGYHHLEMTGVLGAIWKLKNQVSVSLGYGLGTEVLDPDRVLSHGLDLTFEVKRIPLFQVLDAPVFFESRLDVFFKDPGSHNTFRALLSSKVAFSLSNHLALTVGADAFVFSSDSNTPGFSADFTIGLQGFFATGLQRY